MTKIDVTIEPGPGDFVRVRAVRHPDTGAGSPSYLTAITSNGGQWSYRNHLSTPASGIIISEELFEALGYAWMGHKIRTGTPTILEESVRATGIPVPDPHPDDSDDPRRLCGPCRSGMHTSCLRSTSYGACTCAAAGHAGPPVTCPDGGRCWHDCKGEQGTGQCWRTANAAPMGAETWEGLDPAPTAGATRHLLGSTPPYWNPLDPDPDDYDLPGDERDRPEDLDPGPYDENTDVVIDVSGPTLIARAALAALVDLVARYTDEVKRILREGDRR